MSKFKPGSKVKINPEAKDGLIKISPLKVLPVMTVMGHAILNGFTVVEVDCLCVFDFTHNLKGRLKHNTGFWVFEADLIESTYNPETDSIEVLLENFTKNI